MSVSTCCVFEYVRRCILGHCTLIAFPAAFHVGRETPHLCVLALQSPPPSLFWSYMTNFLHRLAVQHQNSGGLSIGTCAGCRSGPAHAYNFLDRQIFSQTLSVGAAWYSGNFETQPPLYFFRSPPPLQFPGSRPACTDLCSEACTRAPRLSTRIFNTRTYST